MWLYADMDIQRYVVMCTGHTVFADVPNGGAMRVRVNRAGSKHLYDLVSYGPLQTRELEQATTEQEVVAAPLGFNKKVRCQLS